MISTPTAIPAKFGIPVALRPLFSWVGLWWIIAWMALVLVPWHMDGSTAISAVLDGKFWLVPLLVFALMPLPSLMQWGKSRSGWLLVSGGMGLVWVLFQGLFFGLSSFPAASIDPSWTQPGIGWGGALFILSLLAWLAQGLADRGWLGGDRFAVWAVGLILSLITIFIVYPLGHVLVSAFFSNQQFSFAIFMERLGRPSIWSLDCLQGGTRCGTVWNSLLLATLTGFSSTLLGLVFALLIARTRVPAQGWLRLLSILPIVTPPFVVGLALILLFGRSGTVTLWFSDLFGIAPSRWIYGLYGIWLAQTLAFAPLAFLVLLGVVKGLSPSLEEAARTLRASPWQIFWTVTFPMLRPGLASAFLLTFIESLSDFGNPLVIGAGYDVLATEIYFAIVGARYDPGRAAILGLLLLSMTFGAFWLQQYWLGRRRYTTVTGKGDGGQPVELPRSLRVGMFALAIPWLMFTLAIYGTILFGGFVEIWGRDHSLTLRHYVSAFEVALTEQGILWLGGAWSSFWTTVWISLAAAPLTAAAGLLTAYLLARKRFGGQGVFEFLALISFATPGTVIGLSYIMAFNLPPIEITGTAMILLISFISRNLPVGIRAGVAAMQQIDRSLDEASATLGANGPQTLRYVLLPLLRPAIFAALVYSFVSAVTAVSAVVFLVSARYDWATSYIIGRVENGNFGVAIAYSSALIMLMLTIIFITQRLMGEVRTGKRDGRAMSNQWFQSR